MTGFVAGNFALQSNQGEVLPIQGNGVTAFKTAQAPGTEYSVGVAQLPPFQRCDVKNPKGTVGSGPVTVEVDCEKPTAIAKTFAGVGAAGGADGTPNAASFNSPFGATVDREGNILIVDVVGRRIRKLTPRGDVSTLAGSGARGKVDGAGANASFGTPLGITVDWQGYAYVVDNEYCNVRRIDPTGTVVTFAGIGNCTSVDNAFNALADFNRPFGITADAEGNLYVAENGGRKIRRIAVAGGVSTIAGTGNPGSDNGGGPTSSFYGPTGIVADGSTLYVADAGGHSIRKIEKRGNGHTVSTLAGGATRGSADGVAAQASFNVPMGLAVLGSTLVVADSENQTIRLVGKSSGVVSTVAGSPLTPGDVDEAGPAARFRNPGGIAITDLGEVYVADTGNHKVRRLLRMK